ncbi:MATE family efflux transporter [Bermanella sp. R86510]|uniref:MATE family efflux transporter n=1 Tax=unclassified Bermanella TaxID=2627862 RepID=UPI0037CBCDAB
MALMIPILGTQLAQTGMGVVDTLVAGTAGTLDLAAIAVGSSVWLPLVLLVSGIMVALTPMAAHSHGRKDNQATRNALQQGLYLALIIGIIAMAILLVFTQPLMALMGVTENIQGPTKEYLDYIAYGLPAVAIYQAFRSYNEGLGLTKPVSIIALSALLLNIPMNLMFVLGFGPIEAMGGPGCGLASLIIFYLAAVVLGLYTWLGKAHQEIQPLQDFAAPKLKDISEINALGLPIGLAIFVEVSLFCIIALFIASLGATTVAAHQITLSVSTLTFMIPLSLAMALTVRVGQELGTNNLLKAKVAWINGLQLNLIFACFNASILYFFSDFWVGFYTSDPDVAELATWLLMFAAIFQLSDSLQVGAAGALRGYKDTLVTLVITVIAFWLIGLPLGHYLGLSSDAPMGAQGFWIGLIAGLSVNALLLMLRLKHVSQKRIQTQAMISERLIQN